jgi:hypothetical protein
MTRAETIQAMKDWCMENYSQGADTMVECWDTEDYERLFSYEGSTVTDAQAWEILKSVAEVYADRQADARNSAF